MDEMIHEEINYDENHIVPQYKKAVAAKMAENEGMTQKEAHRAIRNEWLANHQAQKNENNATGATFPTFDM